MDLKKLLQSLTDSNTYPNSVGLMSMPNAADVPAPIISDEESLDSDITPEKIAEWKDPFQPPTPTQTPKIQKPIEKPLSEQATIASPATVKANETTVEKAPSSLLDKLAEAQKKESSEMDEANIGKALTMIGAGLAGRGRIDADFTLINEFSKKIGKDKRDLIEKQALEEKEQKLAMEMARTQDQLANSKSQRDTEDLVRKQKNLDIQMGQMKVRQEQLSNDPSSGMSTAARSYYSDQLAKIGMGPLAEQVRSGSMSQSQIEDLLGKSNLQNLAAQFDAAQARKEIKAMDAAAKSEAMKVKQVEKIGSIEDGLRKEVTAIDQKFKYSDLKSHMDTLGEQLKSPNGIVDVAMLYGFMKSLDPESVVRESEIGLVLSASSPMVKAFNLPRKFTKGDILPADTRAKMISFMQSELASRSKMMASKLAPHINRAEKAGADLESILPTQVLKEVVKPKEEQKTTAPTGKVRVQMPSGKIGMISAEKLQYALSKGAKEIK